MKKNIQQIQNRVTKKVSRGKELLTVMLVPHSEKKIFTFQVSFFTLIFFAIIFSALVAVAIYALRKQPETYQQQQTVQVTNFQYSGVLNKFLNISSDIYNHQNQISSSFKQLLLSSGYNQNSKLSMPQNISSDIENTLPTSNYLEQLRQLAQFGDNFEKIHNKTNTIIHSIKSFKKLARSLPSIWPLIGSGVLTSGYGPRIDPFTVRPMFHPGVDISAFAGTPIRATADGVIKVTDFSEGTGNMIVIEHKYGFSSVYCHLQKFGVEAGERVRRGEIIGYVGNTGRSAGYHLHYEVRINNETVDPSPFLRLDMF